MGVFNVIFIFFDVLDFMVFDVEVVKYDFVIFLIFYIFYVIVIKLVICNKKNVVIILYVFFVMMEFDVEVKVVGIIVMNEIGFDFGIDYLYVIKIIDEVYKVGGKILSFLSYCGGFFVLEDSDNLLGYKFFWLLRGVLLVLRNMGKWW